MNEIANNMIHLVPFDHIAGYDIRPGFYEINGATEIPGGVNFTIHSNHATSCELLLFHRTEEEPYAVIKFPPHYRIGKVYSMIVFGLNIEEFEYCYRLDGPYNPKKGLIFNKDKYLLDPYARAVTGQSVWGRIKPNGNTYKARVVRDDFDWGDFVQPLIPMEDLVIYELHVRGYTKLDGSITTKPGTYAALMEKLPYLKKLGVNAVELMPIFEFDEMHDCREYNGKQLIDYWGYNTVNFFSPNTGYSAQVEYNREGNELKQLIKTLNENGIEVILDVVFNHTAEGNENGPFFSFKGFDNNIYYMLTPNGEYYNYSGCGNTLNCNHPIVQQMILECLRYWVTYYRVDGFRFDLASILGRNEDGEPMNKPPLIQSLAFDPILGEVKLIAEAWDAGGLYQVGSFPSWNRFAEWNGKYRDDLRSFLKGDEGFATAAVARITGSEDLYDPNIRGKNASVNFITCHDGFTLYDLYSYNFKHNEANGWNNTDGESNNRSWNCGVEGETDNEQILKLRRRLIRNAFAVLLTSRGTPMFLAGDEFCNTQFGNNNPYCQDNEISWIDWSLLEKNKDMFSFVSYMIHFRKQHGVLRKDMGTCSLNFPCISRHGNYSWNAEYNWNVHVVGVMFAGRTADNTGDDIVFIAINTYWEAQVVYLPQLPADRNWVMEVNTFEEVGIALNQPVDLQVTLQPRSVMVLVVKEKMKED
ncbi:glycogen debranching protein GlgX [Anaerosporobacter faecicola]|uniref:glycogen debranching protein GlgX n=1 Tax=Anaerosporobacter faecicola TaxID=2718714 RepID=UPI00143A2282|nr:glycogen debranching protein GlgX [Anaerosporobacter faecicola]